MAVIGNIIVGMGIDPSGLDRGAKVASAGVKSIVSEVQTAGSRIFNLRGALAGLAGALTVGVAVNTLKGLTTSAMESIDVTAKLADRVGATTENLVGLQHAAGLAGVENESLDKALTKVGVNLANAAQGSGPAKDALDQLGLSAQQLAGKDRVEAFGLIADKLNAVQNPAQRSALAVELFGKAGAELAPLLAVGSEGIAQAVAEADKLGISFSRVDAAQVEAANDAMTRAGEALQGVGTKLAIGLAPFIEAAANKFTELATEGIDTGTLIDSAMEFTASAIGVVADVVHTVGLGFLAAKPVVTVAALGFVTAIDLVGKAIEGVINLLPGVEVSFTSTLDVMAEDLARLAGQQVEEFTNALAEPPPSEGIKSFFEEIKSGAKAAAEEATRTAGSVGEISDEMNETTRDVAKLVEKLKGEVASFGLSGPLGEVEKLRRAGATDQQLKEAKGLAQQLDQMKAAADLQKKMQDDAKRAVEENQTPFEKAREEVAKLQSLAAAGLIDPTTLKRGIEKATAEIQPNDLKFAAAAEAGSKEARSALLAARGFTGTGPDQQKDIAANTKRSAATLDQVNAGIQQVATNIGTFLGNAAPEVFAF
jgi:hypothetical protein